MLLLSIVSTLFLAAVFSYLFFPPLVCCAQWNYEEFGTVKDVSRNNWIRWISTTGAPMKTRFSSQSKPQHNLLNSQRIQKIPKGSKRIQKIIKAKHSCHTRWLRAICKTYIDLSIQILGFSVKGQQNPVQPRSRSLELISVLPSLAVLVELVDRCTWAPYSCRMCRSIKYIWLSHSDIKRHSS